MTTTATPTLSVYTDPTPFALKSLRTMAVRNGQAWNATITRDGKPVGTVEQDGNGGSNWYRWTDKDAERAFLEEAHRFYPDEPFEPEDRLAVDLSALAEYGRARSWVYFYGDEPWEYDSPVTYTQSKSIPEHLMRRALTEEPRASRRPFLFDKAAGRFVAVTA